MSPNIVAEQIINAGESPALPIPDAVTPDVIRVLVARVEQLKHQNADEALRIAKVAVAAADRHNARDLLAKAYIVQGDTLTQLYRHAETLAAYEQANAIYAELGNQLALTQLRVRMVITLFVLGKQDEALAMAEQAMIACYELGSSAERDLARLEFSLGLIYMHMGRYDAALRAYSEAKGLLLRLGEIVEAARVDINRANIYQEMDELDSAENIYQLAREALQAFPDYGEQVAVIDLNLGMLARRQGRYQDALRLLKLAEQSGQTNTGFLSNVKLRRAFVYQNLGLFPEVVALASEIEPDLRAEKMEEELAFALQLQGNSYRNVGNWQQGSRFYRASLERFEHLGNRLRILELTHELATVALETADFATCEQLTTRLLNEKVLSLPPMLQGKTHLLRAQLYWQQQNHAAARHEITAAQALATRYHLVETAAQAAALTGQLSADFDTAWSAYQTAINHVELLRSRLWLDEFRLGFMDSKLPIYADAIRLLVKHQQAADWLLYLLDLAQSAPLSQGKLVLSAVDAAELNELRQAWHWQQSKLENEGDADARRAIGTTIHRLEQQISELQRRATHTAGRAQRQRMVDAATAHKTARQIQSALAPASALLHYFLVDQTVYVCVVTCDHIRYFPLTDESRVNRVLKGWLHHLRDLQLIATNPQTAQQMAHRYLMAFDTALVAPLADLLAAHTNLLIVLPHQWHNLPFAAFHDGQRYLIETHQLRFLSAPSVVLEQPFAASKNRPNALILGTSDSGTLPHSVRETQLVAQALAHDWACAVYSEADAISTQIFEQANQLNLLHISTHAVFRPDNPAFSWMQLADKRLTMAELYHADLAQHPLVVLSACETGLGQARGGGLAGMARALLTAGAAHLIVTLWRVESETTADLMEAFYRALDGVQADDVLVALRHAQRTLVGKRHPYFWAGYLFIQG